MTKPLEQDLKAQIDTLTAKNNKLEAAIQEGISTLEALQAENEKLKDLTERAVAVGEKTRAEYKEYKTYYDRIFEKSIVVEANEYSKMIEERDALKAENRDLASKYVRLEIERNELQAELDETIIKMSENYEKLHHDFSETCKHWLETSKERDKLKWKLDALDNNEKSVVHLCEENETLKQRLKELEDLDYYLEDNEDLMDDLAALERAEKELKGSK